MDELGDRAWVEARIKNIAKHRVVRPEAALFGHVNGHSFNMCNPRSSSPEIFALVVGQPIDRCHQHLAKMRHDRVELQGEKTQQFISATGLHSRNEVRALLFQHEFDGIVQLLLGNSHFPIHCLIGRQSIIEFPTQRRDRKTLIE